MPEEKKTVYLTLHKNLVREGIEYEDRRTGEKRKFNQVTLPGGTIIDGRDMGGWEFSPLYVNESRFKGAEWRDVPLLADREVWLRHSILDADGNPVLDGEGRRERETVKVLPEKIKAALAEGRRAWEEERRHGQSLSERAHDARACAEAIPNDPERQSSRDSR